MSDGFADLVAAAQVGTRKAPPPRTLDLGLQGERATLVELGALALIARAGTVGVPATPLTTAPPETARIAEAAADPLAETFEAKAEADALLTEWAVAAAERGLVVPPAVLTDWLPWAKRHPSVGLPVLGERGRWLAGIVGIKLPPAQETLRPTLGEAYDALDWKERGAALGSLQDGLSGSDEPLLLHALDDRRREVREAAAELVLRLPESPPARAMRALAESLLTTRRSLLKTTLDVALPDPERLPKWLSPPPIGSSGLSAGALALASVLAAVPPSVFLRSTGLSPDALLDQAERTDHAAALFDGFQAAALRFDDRAMIDAIFPRSTPPGAARRPEIAQRVSEATFEAVMTRRLEKGEGPFGTRLVPVRGRERPISARLSRLVVEAVRAEVVRDPSVRWIVSGLRDLAPLLDPSVLPLLETPWAEDATVENTREHWRRMIDLRRRLLESLR